MNIARGTDVTPLVLPRIMIWAVLAGVLTFTGADPDLWGHVRFGLDIIRDHGIPSVDPYSFTSDRTWLNHEWLAEVFMAGAFAAAGSVGLSLLKVSLLLAGFTLIARELTYRGLPPMVRDVLVAACIAGCLALTQTLRPQTFSLPLFAALLIALRRVDEGKTHLAWGIPPLLLVWANLHGGWLVGAGVAGLWIAARLVAPRGISRRAWTLLGVTSVLATLGTPYGAGLWRFLWETVGLGRADIGEWQPLTGLAFVDSLPWVTATAVAVIGFSRRRPIDFAHVAVVVLLMLVSFKVMRVVPFYAVAAVLLAGPGVMRDSSAARKPAMQPTPAEIVVVVVLALAFVAASVVIGYRNANCISLTGEWVADQQAARFIRSAGLSGRMLTWFNWGEYAIWFLAPDIRVSMDGRRETVYSDRMIRQHLAVYWGWPGWQEEFRRLDPDHVWLPVEFPTVGEMQTLGWREVFRTERSVVLSRTAVALPSMMQNAGSNCFPGP
ncbi:MAG TPA: hypothetical protein VEK56_03470 [Vicinamibacterales bacterium]|nr:hypothetical protein [Vicinamibacterales bacterium]